MSLIDPLREEFVHEMKVTRVHLERVPEDKFGWAPHPKSMTLGRLASHIAESPGWAEPTIGLDELAFNSGEFEMVDLKTPPEVLSLFDENVAKAADAMEGVSDEKLGAIWRMKMDGRTVIEMPRIQVLRSMILNHTIHHRGQLTVYLRLNGVPVPSSYGPTADEQM
jgi:uncharacterized damage-inducible protein DinB